MGVSVLKFIYFNYKINIGEMASSQLPLAKSNLK